MTNEKLIEFIENELPNSDDGWWSGGAETFKHYAEKLQERGIDNNFIQKMFQSLFIAVSSEYGD